MKKSMLALAAIAMAVAAPAFANDMDHMSTQEKVDMKFEKFDTNKDGMLSKAEMDAAKAEKFSDADMNKDGMLSKAELTTKMEKHKM